jgi:hypothetical protein
VSQLSLDGDALVGAAWDSPHGRCVVVGVDGDRARVQVDGPERAFPMEWPVSLVRRELAAGPEPDEWVSDGDGSYFNATENRRLAALGLVPLAEPATPALPTSAGQVSESRQQAATQTDRRQEMPAVADKPRAKKPSGKSALTELSKAKLRAYLLEHTTIPDKAWNAAYGAPERQKGETRERYIRRVLA